jgi:hypothetical protein
MTAAEGKSRKMHKQPDFVLKPCEIKVLPFSSGTKIRLGTDNIRPKNVHIGEM